MPARNSLAVQYFKDSKRVRRQSKANTGSRIKTFYILIRQCVLEHEQVTEDLFYSIYC